MPFSQQSYTGQGIVQQNVTPRAGEIIGASLANMGQSIGAGIEKFAQRKKEQELLDKKQAEQADAMRGILTKFDLITPQQAKVMGYHELEQYSAYAPMLIAQKKEQQQQSFLSNYAQAQQPQQVTEDVDFGPQIQEAQGNLDAAIQNNRFVVGPENYQYARSSLPGFTASKPQPDYTNATPRTQALPDQLLPTFLPFARRSETVLPDMSISNALKEAQKLSSETQQPSPQPSPTTGPIGPEQMPPEPEEITSMRNKLAELKIQAAEGETTTRPENQAEYQKRIQDFMIDQIKKNPAAASFIADQMTGQKLSPSDMLARQKYADEVQARTIPGLGIAPSAETAKEMRSLQSAYDQVNTGVTRLLEILDTPGKRTNLDLRAEANTITGMLTGALRVPITGPGAFSDSERAMIEKIVQNPTSLWGLDSTKRKALETLRSRIKGSRDSFAKSIGLQPGGDSTQTRMRYNPSTGKFE